MYQLKLATIENLKADETEKTEKLKADSLWRWANTWNVSFEFLCSGQFSLSTQLIDKNRVLGFEYQSLQVIENQSDVGDDVIKCCK